MSLFLASRLGKSTMVGYNWGQLNSVAGAMLQPSPDRSHQEDTPMTTSDHTPLPANEQEEWRPCPGYEGLYEASSFGRFRRSGAGSGRTVGRVKALTPMHRGYLHVALIKDGHGHTHRAHRLVAAAFLGPIPPGMQVHHRDADRTNNHWRNLAYVTARENSEEMVEMGRSLRGERCIHARLTERDVRRIRSLRDDGVSLAAVALAFRISPQSVCDIHKRRTWRHVV
jgi:hypothetical protein